MKRLLTAALLLSLGAAAQAQTFRPLLSSAANCVNNATSLRNYSSPGYTELLDQATFNVGYWGDPNTAEAVYAVSNPVTWPLEQIANVPNATFKRGYYDIGPPRGTSAVALACNEGVVLLNTFQFTHTQPVFGGGPQASLGYKASYPRPIFTTPNSKLVIQGYVSHPFHHWNEAGSEGQIVMGYYVQPLYCAWRRGGLCPAATATNGIPAFAHVIALYSSTNDEGTYDESFGNDGFTGFFSSPLADFQANGQPTAFLTPSIYSSRMAQRYDSWNSYRFYRAEISRAQLQSMIAIQRDASPAIAAATTGNPDDWGVVLVTGLVETFPSALPQCTANTNLPGCHDVSMLVSMGYMEAYEMIPTGARAADAPTPKALRTPAAARGKPGQLNFTMDRALRMLDR